MGCLVHELLVHPTTAYPLKLFAGGRPGANIPALVEEKECVLDSFSKSMVKHFQPSLATSPAARA